MAALLSESKYRPKDRRAVTVKAAFLRFAHTHGGIRGAFYGACGYTQNRFENNLKHDRGVLSMARTMNPNSAGSQFFVMVAKAPHLDGQYASFGKVIEGMEVADAIVSAKRDYNDKPLQDQRMKTVTVETFGEVYPEPVKV